MAAGAVDVPLEYVRLGLRFDRLEPGFVDAYTGDPRVRAAVADEPAPTPHQLRDQARALLAELDSASLPEDRSAYLRGQLTGLECTARKMGGEPVGVIAGGQAYCQVQVPPGDPGEDPAAHAELDRLLPGSGTLAERYAAHRRREECPPQQLEGAVHALSSALRDRVRGQYGLPETETVQYEVVTDKPWSASTTTRATTGPGWRSTPTSRTGSASSRTWSPTRPIRATTPSTAARSAGWSSAPSTWSTPFSWSTPPSA